MTERDRPPGRALLYHLTHLDNLESIIAQGEVVCNATVRQRAPFTEVGDVGIKARRRQSLVPLGPGGTVADYVPFYFAPCSPMMFRISYDQRDKVPDRYQGGVDPLVYLVTSVDTIVEADLSWVCSDGNCVAVATRFSPNVDDLATLVDWPLMTDHYGGRATADDGDRPRRRAAEFLIHGSVPLDHVLGYIVRTPERRQQLATLLADGGRAASYLDVRPNWYPYS
jgi:ssDNA thymidine ADP-ribosyltransferase, DarT